MRIAIDARLNAYRQGGIPQYTRQLITALADVAAEDQIVSFQHRDQLRPLAIAPNVARRTALTPPHHRFEQWMLPLEVLLARPDVLHRPVSRHSDRADRRDLRSCRPALHPDRSTRG